MAKDILNKATEWPFIVNAEQMRVKVTGTKFNVKSYSTEPIAHTTLVEGSVWAYTGQTQVQLNPSEQFRYDRGTGMTSVQKVDTELYTGWIEGMFVFRNQRLEDVMSDLARWYNMTIFYSTAETKEIRISTNLNRYKNIDDLILDLERRSKLQRLLRTVPGFRKGIWWHQLIAVLYDIALLFFMIVAMSTAHSLLDALCTFGFFFFGYAVPVPILTNYLDWTHRIARLQNKTKSQRIWIQISLTALAQVLSVLCIIASPAT